MDEYDKQRDIEVEGQRAAIHHNRASQPALPAFDAVAESRRDISVDDIHNMSITEMRRLASDVRALAASYLARAGH